VKLNERLRPATQSNKLIVFSGARNEKEGDNGAHFYKFENGRFIHLRSAPEPE
jgi:hypothetical protein